MRQATGGQSNLRFPLTSIFASGAAVRVLRALYSHGRPVGTPMLAKESGLTRTGAEKALIQLTEKRLVHLFGSGRTKIYQINKDHPMAGSLGALFEQERQRWTDLIAALREVLKQDRRVAAAWYYGSVARGTDRPDSDFDIGLLVEDDSMVENVAESIRHALEPIEERFYVHFSVVALSAKDVDRLAKSGHEVWLNMARDGRPLKGNIPRAASDHENKGSERDENGTEKES